MKITKNSDILPVMLTPDSDFRPAVPEELVGMQPRVPILDMLAQYPEGTLGQSLSSQVEIRLSGRK